MSMTESGEHPGAKSRANGGPGASQPPGKRKRVLRSATVARTEWLTRDLIRVYLAGPQIAEIESSQHTDRYIKLLFAPAGADYTWPFDPEALRAELPREQQPVTRTYTIRSLDRERGEMAVDFVVHGDDGLAGPWAASAKPGDGIGFYGPGGGWSPDSAEACYLLAGDESAAPAIAAALDAMPDNARGIVVIEVADASTHIPLRALPGVDVRWVHRDETGEPYGQALTRAVLNADLPDDDLRAFVHGNADMIKELRRYLLVERDLPREHASISGYWRSGHTEDRWQASKREFVQQMEAEQDGAPAASEG